MNMHLNAGRTRCGRFCAIEALESRRLLSVDLFPTKIDVPSTPTYSGPGFPGWVDNVVLGYRNGGSSAVFDVIEARIIFSLDQSISGNDGFDSWESDSFSLGATTSREEEADTRTPENFPAGNYYMGVQLDPDNLIAESNESNNLLWTDTPVVRVTNQQHLTGSISGTAGNDVILIEQNYVLFVTINGTLIAVDPDMTNVTTFRVEGLAGDDLIAAQPGTIGQVYYGGATAGHVYGQLRINGGDGNDTIVGGDGDDLLGGNAGKDRIFGGLGRDRLNGHGGHDRLYGESDVDRLYGYAGNDWIDGGSSTDRLFAGTGTDTLLGQGGNDYLFARNSTFTSVFGGSGTDSAQVDDEDELGSIEELLA